jgi:hypothetical protein
MSGFFIIFITQGPCYTKSGKLLLMYEQQRQAARVSTGEQKCVLYKDFDQQRQARKAQAQTSVGLSFSTVHFCSCAHIVIHITVQRLTRASGKIGRSWQRVSA